MILHAAGSFIVISSRWMSEDINESKGIRKEDLFEVQDYSPKRSGPGNLRSRTSQAASGMMIANRLRKGR